MVCELHLNWKSNKVCFICIRHILKNPHRTLSVVRGAGGRSQRLFFPFIFFGTTVFGVFTMKSYDFRDVEEEANRLTGTAGRVPSPRRGTIAFWDWTAQWPRVDTCVQSPIVITWENGKLSSQGDLCHSHLVNDLGLQWPGSTWTPSK